MKANQKCLNFDDEILPTKYSIEKKWLSFTDLQIYEYKNIKGDICSEMYISD